ncbi:unnamed protein product, partial [Effrenium voratum]
VERAKSERLSRPAKRICVEVPNGQIAGGQVAHTVATVAAAPAQTAPAPTAQTAPAEAGQPGQPVQHPIPSQTGAGLTSPDTGLARPSLDTEKDLGTASFEERLDAIVGNFDLEADLLEEVPLLPEEKARRDFAERLRSQLDEASLSGMLKELQTDAPKWGPLRRMRSVALLLVHVSRASRACRGVFVAQGLPLVGELLTDSIGVLEAGPPEEHQEAAMRSLACLACLTALAVGRATMWEHRHIMGKAFDRLHRWCGREKTALAAEVRAPCMALCRRWRQQPKPAVQDTPQNKALRVKVLELIKQGLEGEKSERPIGTVASEIEATLYAMHKGATADYRQHARMLRNNMVLPGNESLRERILCGEIVASELVRMDSRSLAPQTLQEKRRAEELEALKSVVLPGTPLAKPMDPPAASFDWPKDVKPEKSEKEMAMEPPAPPTPFQEGLATPVRPSHAPNTPEAMATPAPDDDDEQAEELIRYFSQQVH